MSRLGKKPIVIPAKTEVTISEGVVTVKGPNGELKMAYRPSIEIKIEEGTIVLSKKNEELETEALWGTYASILENNVAGVNQPFSKRLIVEGVGYKAEVKGDKLVMALGFSHPIELAIPKSLKVTVDPKEGITVSGIDKQEVGQFAAVIRSYKKPEPYKGKGIRYSDEVIKRKEGKKAA